MNYNFLSDNALFHQIPTEDMKKMLQCLQAKTKQYTKGEIIYLAGEPVQALGVILAGGVSIENDDIWGNHTILNHLTVGNIFAESYACLQKLPLMVNVIATEPTEVLFLNVQNVLTTCPNTCSCHKLLINNLLMILAQKNQNLSNHIFCTSAKTIRGRLVSYLSYLSTQQKSTIVTSPFNRQQLADYLGVDRSALSNELSKMQKEGFLTFRKNIFQLQNLEQ